MIDSCELHFSTDFKKYQPVTVSETKWGGLAKRSELEQGEQAVELMEKSLDLVKQDDASIITVLARKVEDLKGRFVGLNLLQIHGDNPGEVFRVQREAEVLRDRLDSHKKKKTPISTIPTHLNELARLQ